MNIGNKSQNAPFCIDPNVIENNIFTTTRCSNGKKSYLYPNFLPNLFWYIKSLCTDVERNSVKDYDLQVFIIETAIMPKKFTDLNTLTDHILNEIRNDTKYWINGTEPFVNICKKLDENEDDETKKRKLALISKKDEHLGAINDYNKYYTDMSKIKKTMLIDDKLMDNIDLKLNNLESNNQIGELISNTNILKRAFQKYEKMTNDERQHDLQKIDTVGVLFDIDFNFDLYETIIENYTAKKNIKTSQKRVLTRGQEKKIRNIIDVPQDIIEKYIKIYKILRDDDFNQSKTALFLCSKYRKIPKADIQVFPCVYQFFAEKYDLYDDNDEFFLKLMCELRLVNLIHLLLVTDDPMKNYDSRYRITRSAFQDINMANNLKNNENSSSNSNSMSIEEAKEIKSIDFDPPKSNSLLYREFVNFCKERGLDMDVLLHEENKRGFNQLNLIDNSLNLINHFLINEKFFKINYQINDLTLDKTNLDAVSEIIYNLENYDNLTSEDYERICKYFAFHHEKKNFKEFIQSFQQFYLMISNYKQLKKKANPEKEELFGAFMNKKAVDNAIDSYIAYINSPTAVKKRSYIFHTTHPKKWTNEEIKKFLEGLQKYFDLTINNKKIAKHMGNHIKPNHVRFVKGKYLRKLRKRAKASGISMKKLLQADMFLEDFKDLY